MSQIKKVVFISNFFNHHQKPVSDELYAAIGDGYCFIETSEMSIERKKMGWSISSLPCYVIKSYEQDKNDIVKLINEADAVIVGGALEEYLVERKKNKKIIIRYSERPLKNGLEPIKYLGRFIKWHFWNPKKIPIYMLCASAYTSYDYSLMRLFKNKCFKWGYFPEYIEQDINQLILSKEKKSVTLLFVSRLIELKHPEFPLLAIKKLVEEGVNANLKIIGDGPLRQEIDNYIEDNKLHDYVTIVSSMSPKEVRKEMDKGDILLFTSNKIEGWGAVVNEAMNSACCVVGSSEIGSIPYLIKDGQNGLIYEGGNFESFFMKVKKCCDEKEKRIQMGIEAYKTISSMWNAKVAARRLLELLDALINKKEPNLFEDGPCSSAQIIKDGWYKDE